MQIHKISLLFIFLALPCLQLFAAEEEAVVAQEDDIPFDEYDRGTPRRSVDGFMAAVDEADYEAAAEYLDLRNLRGIAAELTGVQLARRLSVIAKRGDWVDVGDLVDDPNGRRNDGLPEYRDLIGVVLSNDKEVRLLMQKVPRGDGVFIWKVSNSTVTMIPDLYEVYGYPESIEKLRRSLPEATLLGYETFKWVLVLAAAVLAYLVVLLGAIVVRRAPGDPEATSRGQLVQFLLLPFGLWVVIITINAVATSLGSGVRAEAWHKISPIPVLATVWMMFTGIKLVHEAYANALRKRGRPGAAVLLTPAANTVKIIITTCAVLIYLDKLGFNITTLLAGLGVGGIAVALALQKPMEDVFGAFTLFTQQPIRLGDFCRVGSETGTVEEISLRTTRLRTLADTVIAIPNARLANEAIDNISARKKIRYRPILRLRYDTRPEQIRKILVGIRELLAAHERVLQEGPRVNFLEIGDEALVIEGSAYLDTTVWSEYLELAGGLNLAILEVIEGAGAKLARPIFHEHGGGAGS